MSVPIWHTRCAMIFDEWAKRYSRSPEEFSEILDEDGKPIKGYGERCAAYFTMIAREMDEKNELPRYATDTSKKSV